MAPISFIVIISIFTFILVSSIVFSLYFWLKTMKILGEKSNKKLRKPQSIYERMADDQDATEQFIYMRRKLFGG